MAYAILSLALAIEKREYSHHEIHKYENILEKRDSLYVTRFK